MALSTFHNNPVSSSSYYLFFFLLTPPPSVSTLFPYTTLFRSVHFEQIERRAQIGVDIGPRYGFLRLLALPRQAKEAVARSEEHTSELQSRGHLVCRLLLEKKNKERTKRRRIEFQTKTLPIA